MKPNLLALMVSVCVLQHCVCHIRLTYPQARKYEFDFLDNVRTKGPCGMPSGLGTRTNLQAGEQLDIHWHIAYPHRGGFYFEILNSAENKIARYPTTGFAGTKDGTKLQYSIQLPNTECHNCTVRMVRQAAEWTAGPNTPYLFWSCADVNIVQSLPNSERCSGHGTYTAQGTCACQRLYTGDRCQFKDECLTDNDCSGHGICVDTHATSYPKKQCYCERGWFGTQCQRQSSVSTVPANMAAYQTRDVNDKVKIYYRIVDDEIEVMMKAKTASWMGLGWRAPGTQPVCRDFPNLPDKYVPEGSAEAEGSAESEGGTAEGEAHAEGNSTAEAEGTAEGEYNATAEAEAESEAEYNGTSEAEAGAESEYNSTAEAEATAEGGAHAENGTAEAEGSPEGTAEGEDSHAEGEYSIPDACPADGASAEGEAGAEGSSAEGEGAKAENGTADGEYSKADGGSAEGSTAEGSTSEGASAEGGSSAGGSAEGEGGSAEGEGSGGSSLHHMDCTDIVIGSARGMYSRVGDYYTRDRSTPVHDEYLGGVNSLTAAMAWEEGEYTHMLFRKKLTSSDPADHSLKDELTHVIWAMGQKHGDYRHCPGSSLEAKRANITDFYKTDELKYHGHGSSQRGAITLNFFATPAPPQDDCTRGSCPASQCSYDLTWVLDTATDTITFTLSADFMAEDQWLAIGFSNNRQMPSTDVVYGGMNGGTFMIQDGWIGNRRVAPTPDASQDVTLVSGSHENGRTTMTFTRKRTTGDSNDFQITDDNCPYLIYAKGGNIRASGAITKHFNTPVVSAQRICFGICPAKRRFRTPVSVKITGVTFQPELSDKASRAHVNLKQQLTPLLERAWRERLGNNFVSVNILGFRPGSVIVDFDVITTSSGEANEANIKQTVQAAAQEVTQAQALGQYQLDPNYLEVKDTQAVEAEREKQKSEMLSEVEIIIIAVVVSLVVVAAIIGICKFVEMRRANRADKQSVMRESSTSSASSERNSIAKSGTMTYGEFMASSPGSDVKTGFSDVKQPPPYPAYVNPGYESAGYKNVP